MRIFLRTGLALPNCKASSMSTITACPRLALGACGKHFLYVLFFMLFSIGVVRSQSPEREAVDNKIITPLNIGDQIPDELWNTPLQVVNHPEGKETITLADYKGKLIILDFWATWCVPCIRNFPKLHGLQNEFNDAIKVLAVTQEDTDRINTFFTTGVGQKHTYLNSVVNDSILSQYITYKSVPHIAWIDPDGKFINATQAKEVTKANIQSILDGDKAELASKIDIDRDRPLFISEHFNDDLELKSYSIFSKSYYPGLPNGNKEKKTKDGVVYGRQMTNATMMIIYRVILTHLFEREGEKFNSKRIIVDVKKPALLDLIKKTDGGNENYNIYNYELIVPKEKSDSLYDYMLADLNRYSDYIGVIEKRMVDYLALVKTSTDDKIKSNGEKARTVYPSTTAFTLTNRPMDYIVNLLNGDTPIKLPIFDETGYTDNVDIEITDYTDLEALRDQLNRYDLDLVPAKQQLDMFVIKDK